MNKVFQELLEVRVKHNYISDNYISDNYISDNYISDTDDEFFYLSDDDICDFG